MTARSVALKGIIASTDQTFAFEEHRGRTLLVGKCLMCRRKKVAWEDGVWSPVLTIEHIEPRHHGGSDTLANLGLACDACNHRKGRRVDNLKSNAPERRSVVERLLTERRERLRLPVRDTRFGPLVEEVLEWVAEDPQWMHLELR